MVKNLSNTLVSKMCGELSGEGVENLKENLNVGFVVVDITIASIDEAANGRLRDPSNSLVKDGSFHTIEEPAPVAKDILDIAVRAETGTKIVLPSLDFGEFSVVPGLNSFNFRSKEANTPG